MSAVPAGVVGLDLRPGDHVCGFYRGDGDRDEITAAWVTEGAKAGQKCICYVDESTSLIQRFGAEIPDDLRHVEFCDADAAYAPGGSFSKDAMLHRLQTTVSAATDAGYGEVRLLGDMSWVMRAGVDTETVFAYEAEVNALSPRQPAAFLCLYDLNRFDGSLVFDVLRTHAKILLNGLVIHNPYYVSPGKLLDGD